jgi:hypothetical protein
MMVLPILILVFDLLLLFQDLTYNFVKLLFGLQNAAIFLHLSNFQTGR